MRILGIDPGYGRLGWSVIEKNLCIVDFGTIETSAELSLADRLLQIHNQLGQIISTCKPETASIEKLFFTKNTKTAIDVAKTIGVVVLTLKLGNIDFSEYTPTQVKQALTGSGRADKKQMQLMVKRIFNLRDIPRPDDAADALAIAACHSFRYDLMKKII